MSSDKSNDKRSLTQFLSDAGAHLGVHFTVEYGVTKSGHLSPLQSNISLDSKLPDTVNALLTTLRENVKSANIVQNAKNPRIIHIIDRSVDEIKNYVMNSKTSLTYSGVLADLPDALGAVLNGAIVSRRIYSGAVIRNDWINRVQIKVENDVVRDILTDSVPLDGYSACIWNTTTWNTAGKWETWCQYDGPSSTGTGSASG